MLITIDLLGGVIAKDDVPISVSTRERAIALALAVHRSGLSRERLADLLSSEESSSFLGVEGIKVYVHRLRRRAGFGFIVSHDRIYSLGRDVVVRSADGTERIGPTQLRRMSLKDLENLRLHARRLRSPVPPGLESYHWYAALAIQYQCLGRQLALHIAREMADRDLQLEAIQIATELTFEDPCDEDAWAEVIRSQLSLGQRSEALHGFRFLRSALERDLGVKPSTTLNALFAN